MYVLGRLAGIGAGAVELEADLLPDDDELVRADLGERGAAGREFRIRNTRAISAFL